MSDTVLVAIAKEEGYYKPGSRAARNLNPGNIDFKPWMAEKYQATIETPIGNETPRFARFLSESDGFDAGRTLLNNSPYLGKTLLEVANIWAPPVENNTSEYAQNLSSFTGLSLDTVLTPELIG